MMGDSLLYVRIVSRQSHIIELLMNISSAFPQKKKKKEIVILFYRIYLNLCFGIRTNSGDVST